MKVKELKEYLKHFNDEDDVFIRNSYNALGNISDLQQLEKSTYGFFGSSLPCLILNSGHNCIETNKGKYDDVIETSGRIGESSVINVIVKGDEIEEE